MSLAQAVAEIDACGRTAERRRHLAFRARQRAIDALIGDVECLVAGNVSTLPAEVRHRAEPLVAIVDGGVPAWLGPGTTSSTLLNELFVAEGRLRRRHYVDLDLDLEESV